MLLGLVLTRWYGGSRHGTDRVRWSQEGLCGLCCLLQPSLLLSSHAAPASSGAASTSSRQQADSETLQGATAWEAVDKFVSHSLADLCGGPYSSALARLLWRLLEHHATSGSSDPHVLSSLLGARNKAALHALLFHLAEAATHRSVPVRPSAQGQQHLDCLCALEVRPERPSSPVFESLRRDRAPH